VDNFSLDVVCQGKFALAMCIATFFDEVAEDGAAWWVVADPNRFVADLDPDDVRLYLLHHKPGGLAHDCDAHRFLVPLGADGAADALWDWLTTQEHDDDVVEDWAKGGGWRLLAGKALASSGTWPNAANVICELAPMLVDERPDETTA